MATVSITSGPVAGKDTKVLVGGEDVTGKIRRLTFDMEVNDLVTVELEYVCLDGIEFEGHATVIHKCGLEGGDGADSS